MVQPLFQVEGPVGANPESINNKNVIIGLMGKLL